MENVKRDKKMKQHKTQETTLLATQPTSNSKNSNRNNKMTFFSQQRHTSTKPKPLSLSLLYLFLLTCCTSLGSVQASSLGFQYDNVAGCSSSVAEINSLSVSCDGNGDSSVCRTGDRVRVMGTCKLLATSSSVGAVFHFVRGVYLIVAITTTRATSS